MPIPRLFLADDFTPAARLDLDEDQARYLAQVLRLGAGSKLVVFNGRDGEFAATLESTSKRGATIKLDAQTRPQAIPPDLLLLFSPLKRQATDWLVEKATELGARSMRPVIMRRTVSETVRTDRLISIAREAAEQTERLDVPEILEAISLTKVFDGWDAGRPLIYADEAGEAPPILSAVQSLKTDKLALLIGPEGGFDGEERRMLRDLDFVRPVSLGPRILRAETAATTALALIQAAWGDWR